MSELKSIRVHSKKNRLRRFDFTTQDVNFVTAYTTVPEVNEVYMMPQQLLTSVEKRTNFTSVGVNEVQ